MRKRKKLREDLNIGEKGYILAERTKKKSTPGKLYKQSVQITKSYFNKDVIYTIRKKHIDNIRYYWVKTQLKNLPKRFQRTELFALKSNFFNFFLKIDFIKKKSVSKKKSLSKKIQFR